MPRCGSRRRATTVALAAATAALTLAGVGGGLAPSAMAQSAGDDQYVDPLLGEGRGGGGGEDPQPPSEGAGDGASGTPAAPSAPPAAPAAPTDTNGAAPATGQGVDPAATLPRTGAEPGPLIALGVALVAAGALLRPRAGGRARA